MYDEFMDERSIEALQTSLAGVCGHVNAQQARLVRLVERALVGEAWKQIGIHSASHWLAWQAGVTTSTAQKVLAVARRAEQHPLVMAAFDNGELSLDQACLAMRAPGWTDAEICGLARVLTVQQLSMVVRKYPFTLSRWTRMAWRCRRCRWAPTPTVSARFVASWHLMITACSRGRCVSAGTPCSTAETRMSTGRTP